MLGSQVRSCGRESQGFLRYGKGFPAPGSPIPQIIHDRWLSLFRRRFCSAASNRDNIMAGGGIGWIWIFKEFAGTTLMAACRLYPTHRCYPEDTHADFL